MQPLPQPSLPPTAPIPAAQGTPSMEELIQQSQWNLQQQEQHLLALRQVSALAGGRCEVGVFRGGGLLGMINTT